MKKIYLTHRFLYLLLSVVMVALNACKKSNSDGAIIQAPTVQTTYFKVIDSTSVSMEGIVDVGTSGKVLDQGFTYDTQFLDPIANIGHLVSCGTAFGQFSATITGLKPNTTYYFAAYGRISTLYGISAQKEVHMP